MAMAQKIGASAAGQTAMQQVASKVGTSAATSAASGTAMSQVLGKVGGSAKGVLPAGSAMSTVAGKVGGAPGGKQLVGNDFLAGVKNLGKKMAAPGKPLKAPSVKDRQAKQDELNDATGVSDLLAEALSGTLNPGSMVRAVGEQLPKGSPMASFAQSFGNAFDPTSGGFRPDALWDKDVNKYLGEQRKHLSDLLDGDPGGRPIDTIVSALMGMFGGEENG